MSRLRSAWHDPLTPLMFMLGCLAVAIAALVFVLLSFHSDATTARHEAARAVESNNAKWCKALGNIGRISITVPTTPGTTPTGYALKHQEQAIIQAFRDLYSDPAYHCQPPLPKQGP
jgi:hypothetical protein